MMGALKGRELNLSTRPFKVESERIKEAKKWLG